MASNLRTLQTLTKITAVATMLYWGFEATCCIFAAVVGIGAQFASSSSSRDIAGAWELLYGKDWDISEEDLTYLGIVTNEGKQRFFLGWTGVLSALLFAYDIALVRRARALYLAAQNKDAEGCRPWIRGAFAYWIAVLVIWGTNKFALDTFAYIVIVLLLMLSVVIQFSNQVPHEEKKQLGVKFESV